MSQSHSQGPRRGNTRRYRTEKLVGLEAQLEHRDHKIDTPTRDYGGHDPLSVPLNPCERCGGGGVMQRDTGAKRTRWVVVCGGCGSAVADPVKRPWRAALEWNARYLKTAPPYTALPLFGLSSLAPDEAFERLKAIRRDLEARKKTEGLRRDLRQERGQRAPGRRYQERLDAYLQWALYAIRLVGYQSRGDSQPTDRAT